MAEFNAQSHIHAKIMENMDAVCSWYKKVASALPVPIYSSYDIRDAAYKITNVDANIFPAGFNNICPADKESAVEIIQKYIKDHYGPDVKKIFLITEEHTANLYYWENAYTILNLLNEAGFEARAAMAKPMDDLEITSAAGHKIQVGSAMPGSPYFENFRPDLLISNNDFSDAHEEWAKAIEQGTKMNPPRELGWYQRKKSRYFHYYNELVNEFCQHSKVDPFLLRVETEEFANFEIESAESREQLALRVDAMLARLKEEYAQRGIAQEPFVFVKNNAGTYGLAVIRVANGDEVRQWTYKSRKKMKAAKGGRDVEEVIIQEGIPSTVKSDGASAEPVIYMIGCELAGGFLRTHAEKDETESLNSPGAVYKRLCVSDLLVNPGGCPKENVYGWSAKLGLLAIAREAQEMKAVFKGYRP